MIVADVIQHLQSFAPFSLQEDYDNSGLFCGSHEDEVTGILITLDITLPIIDEAIANNCNLIVSHHPITLAGLKQISGKNTTEKIIIKAIKSSIAILCVHTNVDKVSNGVSSTMAKKLNLSDCSILKPEVGLLKKLITFVPNKQFEQVRAALFESGAGEIGNYNSCSYNTSGYGTFKALENANPFVGEIDAIHTEDEIKLEVVFQKWKQNQIIEALHNSHPYETPAFDIISLDNTLLDIGYGIIGKIISPMDELEFLNIVKEKFNCKIIKHTELSGKPIKSVALCGGSGSFLIQSAIQAKADIFITGDIKYHQFFEAENKLILADIGHFESEQFTKELFFELLTKKFPNFAIHLSKVNSNPIKYL